jgi:hypothetical protein
MGGFHYKLSELNKEWISRIPKTINSNGCHIPISKPDSYGYSQITIEGVGFKLSRLVVSIHHNLNYYDKWWDTRHSKDCSTRCIYIEHLQYGTRSDNMKDIVLHGDHHNANKKVCPKCNGPYITRIIKTGINRGKIERRCISCRAEYDRKRKH